MRCLLKKDQCKCSKQTARDLSICILWVCFALCWLHSQEINHILMHTLGLYLTPLNKDPGPLNTELLEHFENRV